ncbi:hypothetical protein [Actinoplanes philippinensis]|uniref:hypothetical protein n=1 Tax=Actinoplanes philippinensis TaxID=35752 RepID=UPI0033E67E9E
MDLYRADLGNEDSAYQLAEALQAGGYDAQVNGEWVDLSPDTVERMAGEIDEGQDGQVSGDRAEIVYGGRWFPMMAQSCY